jgi:hypothetical protein
LVIFILAFRQRKSSGFENHPRENGGRPIPDIKNFTAEVAEHAEVEMAKCLRPGCRGKSGPLTHPSRKVSTAPRGFQRTISALSASSSFILWSSSPEDRKAKGSPY